MTSTPCGRSGGATFALAVRQESLLFPTAIRRALSGRTLSRVEIEIRGTVEQRRSAFLFSPAGHPRERIQLGIQEVPPARREEAMAPFRALNSALVSGQTAFVIRGELRDDGRGRGVVILLVTSAPAEAPGQGG